jgi:hypothetical protein
MALGVLAGLVMPLAVGAAGRETNVDRRVQLILQNASHDEKLPLRIFVPEGPWQHVYVFGGYTSEKRINETLGFTWASHIAKTQEMNEASILIVFVRNGRVIKHLRVPIATGFVCVSQSSIWRLKNGKC